MTQSRRETPGCVIPTSADPERVTEDLPSVMIL
jgi:hypothetical protein